jgi:guanosine-3',5'-bis(diphosphate) 3'-pyrophosphohydrolase|tara:strand:+ start:26288 stop:27094 length:807 start_codon:yes stop_codon:yes gene_type:complete
MSLLLNKAKTLATQAHQNQTRKFDNSPYINHLNKVKAILEHFNFSDVKHLCAALLHDVIEDTSVTSIEIEETFGVEIRSMVEQLTDDKSLPLKARQQATINKLVDQQAAIHVIKLADLISNLSALPPSWKMDKRKDYFNWCENLIAACNKAPVGMIRLAEYLLWNQSGESDDFDVLKRWVTSDNLYWSEEKQALLFVGFTEVGELEAHIMLDETGVINTLFSLGLLRGFFADSATRTKHLVVNTLPKSVIPRFEQYYLDCCRVKIKNS